MAQLKSTKVFGDLNVTGEVNASIKITVNGKEVWHTGSLLNIGTTAATARTALGLGAQATRWPTFAEVTGKPTNYETTWSSVAAKPAQATRWPTFTEVTDKPAIYPTNWATVANKPIVQTVGTSITNLMSQKAITDALGQPSMTGSATLNGTTDNTVQLTAIVTTLGLEVGDVIRIQYSGYDKLHTVESITSNDLIVVNYEHAGNRCNGSLKLADLSTTVTITRIAKWYNAPIGVGQACVDMTSSRAKGTTYTNTTGVPIQILVQYQDSGGGAGATFSIGSLTTTSADLKGRTEYVYWFSAVIPHGSTYRISGGIAIPVWWELR